MRHFHVYGTLTLGDGITVYGNNNFDLNQRRRGGIEVFDGGRLYMENGAIIEGNGFDGRVPQYNHHNNGWEFGGGGVRVGAGAIFTMNGGIIRNNNGGQQFGNSGGGVAVGECGIFIMNDGEISNNNSAGRDGGGVSVGNGWHRRDRERTATFIMNGGVISGNRTGSSGRGAGVAVYNGSTFTMNYYARIINNIIDTQNTHVSDYGGIFEYWLPGGAGIFLLDANFIMNDGEISGNTVISTLDGNALASAGGGIRATGIRSNIEIHGGEIHNNSARHGGGIFILDSLGTLMVIDPLRPPNSANRLTITGGTIRDNTAALHGGGILFTGDERQGMRSPFFPELTMTGGSITGNTAVHGGGIALHGCRRNNLIPTEAELRHALGHLTISSAAVFNNNTATAGLLVNDNLVAEFAAGVTAPIRPGTVSYPALPHALTNHDIQMVENDLTALKNVQFILAGNDVPSHPGMNNRLLGGIDVPVGNNFTSTIAEHAAAFPTHWDIRNATAYILWPNQFGYGFQEWDLNTASGRVVWRLGSPTGPIVDPGGTFSHNVPSGGLRLYATVNQLLIINEDTLRTAVSRTSAGVPARLVLQNSFVLTGAGVMILSGGGAAGRDIALTSLPGENFEINRPIGTDSHFAVNGSTLRLYNITLSGSFDENDPNHADFARRSGGVGVSSGSTLYMNPESVIRNNAGGGQRTVNVWHGNLIMNGGMIKDNFGRGVYLSGTSQFTMNGGTISGNRTTAHIGGGVHVANQGTFTMNGGDIANNSSTIAGGGIGFANNGTDPSSITINGGTISGNEAPHGGGIGFGSVSNPATTAQLRVALNHITIAPAAEFNNNTATAGGFVNDMLVPEFATGATAPIRPGTVTAGAHALTNHDIHISGAAFVPQYRITFLAGTVPGAILPDPNPRYISSGSAIGAVPDAISTDMGWIFTGWRQTWPSVANPPLLTSAEVAILVPTGNMDFTAQWGPAFTLTFHLYIGTGHPGYTQVLNAFNHTDFTMRPNGYLAVTVPVTPGTGVLPVLPASVADVGMIQSTSVTAAGFAFWGWFDNAALATGVGRTDLTADGRRYGLRRPAVGTLCLIYECQFFASTTLLERIAAANTPTARTLLFGNATNGNIDLFSVWALWGDVNDDDEACSEDIRIIEQFLYDQSLVDLGEPRHYNVPINIAPGMVRLRGTLDSADVRRIEQYLFDQSLLDLGEARHYNAILGYFNDPPIS